MATSWPAPTYVVKASFRAPLSFVYRWCTDYTTKDAVYEGEHYQRRILLRKARQVVYEDLEDTKDGWFWARHDVRLYPPDRWHSNSVGSHRAYSLDYRLSSLTGNRTQLTLTAHRRPYGIGGKNPGRAGWERSVAVAWKRFGRAIEKDYRRASSKKSRK